MKAKTIYLVYSHEYNAGYIGKTGNVKERCWGHCGDKRTCVKQFFRGSYEIKMKIWEMKRKVTSRVKGGFIKWTILGLYFVYFWPFKNYYKNCRLQWELNSDNRSRGWGCWQLDHHHNPWMVVTFYWCKHKPREC